MAVGCFFMIRSESKKIDEIGLHRLCVMYSR